MRIYSVAVLVSLIYIVFLVLILSVPSAWAPIEVTCYWTNATGAPEGHVYEMQISYNDATTWEPLLDNIPSDPSGTTSTIMPEILGRAYQVRIRAWDGPDKNFYGLWSDPSRKFMLMYFVGPPEFTGVIR